MNRYYSILILIALFNTACNTTTVRTTEYTPAIQESASIPEDQLLDVGINIFNPGIDELEEVEGVFPQVRKAEARYMPYELMETLQTTGNWGVVRVIPNRKSEMDVWVDGQIVKSDGETLELAVRVQDSSGRTWFTKSYEEVTSKYAYEGQRARTEEPFQGIYNKISNDMVLYRRQLNSEDLYTLRTITELKFAKSFAPDAYDDHIAVDEKGRYLIRRIPADNDPVLQRVRRVRERDYMFVDTLQEYYGEFSDQMHDAYMSWRQESYFETMALREVKSKANQQLLIGAAAIGLGILGAGSNNPYARAAGYTAIGAGLYAGKEGLGTREEAKIHAQALEELGASLNAEVESHTITLEDRTVTLSGTVDDWYNQWRNLLRDIYITETGQIPADN
jgi:hypothetical protein